LFVTTTLTTAISALRARRKAVILAHYYQRPEVQDIADFVGDSLDLSRKAAATDAEVIVFCGVHFMAETAKILSPQKTVLLPDKNAGCPMANMLTRRELLAFKAQHPGAACVAYVNCSAEIKAEVDVCCTSANAVKVIETIPRERAILFVPDQSLGDYVARVTKRDLVLWPGFCPTHHRFLRRDVEEARAAHPGAPVCVHPECTHDIVDLADFVGSTSQILRFCRESSAREFIVGTETGILHPLRTQNPGKVFQPLSELGWCSNMKLITLEKILWALEDNAFEITLPEETRRRALASVERMIAIG
jgi:quinolinate synthase